MTEHTQRISYFLGLPTTWPPALRAFALGLVGRSKWLHSPAHAHRAASADRDVSVQNGIVMPSIGASQLTRSTRFQAIMMRPSACTRRCMAVPPNRRCCSRRYSIIMNLERTVQAFFRRFFDRDIGDDAAGARARLLRIHARAGKAAHAGFKQPAVVIDQRHGLDRVGLTGLARHPVPSIRREQSEPRVELAVVEQARFVQQKLLTAIERREDAAKEDCAGLARARRSAAARGAAGLRARLGFRPISAGVRALPSSLTCAAG